MPDEASHTRRHGSGWRAFASRSIRAARDPQLSQILHAYALLLIMDLAVRWIGLVPVWRRVMARCRSGVRSAGVDQVDTDALLRAIRCAAAHHLYPMKCLQQSLVLAWLLAARGIATDLRLGVSRDNGAFEAHAWLELEGVAINDSPETTRRFVPLAPVFSNKP